MHLASPDGESEAMLWLDEGCQYLILFTGDSLPDVNRRSLRIEPMTCAPSAFQSGEGLIGLAAAVSFSAGRGIEPS